MTDVLSSRLLEAIGEAHMTAAAEIPRPTFEAPTVAETLESKARRLLRSAKGAAEQLESDVRELVAMRAWEVLGYENFSEMWEEENGFACPTLVRVLAVMKFDEEGMRGQGGGARGGHTTASVGAAVGFPVVSKMTSNGEVGLSSPTVSSVLRQTRAGVPPHEVGLDGRRRQRMRRPGAAPDELIQTAFKIRKSDADEVREVARKANVPDAEIYRQAVAEYLARYRASRTEVA